MLQSFEGLITFRQMSNYSEAHQIIQRLVERWCDRCELAPLRMILPHYPIRGTTSEGWYELYGALKDARIELKNRLPIEEIEMIRLAMIPIADALDKVHGSNNWPV
jgi:hypothetical protein